MQSALEINNYIQPLRGKFIDANKVVRMFPELLETQKESAQIRSLGGIKGMKDTMYVLFVDGQFSFSTRSFDDASDFLYDTPNSQGFQFSDLLGLAVCPCQQK